MSASFYDLMKYAATGIASPDMTAYDKMRARAMTGGYPVRTIEGVPPISFTSDGKPLTAWSIYGNGQQTGTPTPSAPVQPEFVGDKTANLVDSAIVQNGYYGVNAQTYSTFTADTSYRSFRMQLKAGTYTLRISAEESIRLLRVNNDIDGAVAVQTYDTPYTFTLSQDTNIYASFRNQDTTDSFTNLKIMLNLGSTALPYEPYGYKIPITTSQTVPVYLGQTQTVRRVRKLVLTGEENITSSHTDIGLFNIPVTDYLKAVGVITNICTHYQAGINVYGWSEVTDLTCRFYGNAAPSKLLYIRDSSFSTVADFKTYLSQQYANGTPVTVWYVIDTPETGIVNEPLCMVYKYADELHSTDAGIIIPTAKGENVLTFDTDLQPSKVSITGHIKE